MFLLNNIKSEIKILIRRHPMSNIKMKLNNSFLKITYSQYSLENDFKIVNKVIGMLFSMLEAYSFGLMVGLVQDENNLNYNPFDNTGIFDYYSIKKNCDLIKFLKVKKSNNKVNISKIYNFFNF